MLIGELSRRTGVSTRALRHYEERGLLVPARTASGYRQYDEDAVAVVHRIQALFAAGLNAETVGRALDCVRGDVVEDVTLQMCPQVRAEVNRLTDRLSSEVVSLTRKLDRLARLASEERQ